MYLKLHLDTPHLLTVKFDNGKTKSLRLLPANTTRPKVPRTGNSTSAPTPAAGGMYAAYMNGRGSGGKGSGGKGGKVVESGTCAHASRAQVHANLQ